MAESGDRPVRVLFHIRHFGVGGIEAALLGWIKGLDRRRFAPALSIFLPTQEWCDVWRERIPDDVPVFLAVPGDDSVVALHQRRRQNRLNKAQRLWLYARLRWVGNRHLKPHLRDLQNRCDLMVDFDLSLRPWIASLAVPVLAVRHFAFWGRRNAKARRVGRDLQGYQRILVLNDDMRRQAQALYGDDSPVSQRCRVLPNLFDLQEMRQKAKAPLPATAPLGGDQPYAICVARLDIATKGLDTLIEAWRAVVIDEPSAQLVLVGGGTDEDRLKQQIQAAGLSGSIHLVGMQTNPYAWIAKARVLVMASRTEGAPNVLVEAMTLGTPVVATDCPVGPADTLANGRYGALVPVDDVLALAQALLRAWRDEGWRRGMSTAGLQRAQDYGRDKSNVRFEQVVREVLAPAAPER